MQISKSEYMLYLKHPAWLWIKKHAKHLMPSVDEALQAYIDIEAFARDQQYDYESVNFDGVTYWYRV